MPVSLHTHSWYSLLEGVSSPEALLARAAEGGHTALALTDTNNLYGTVAFAAQAFRHGIRPLLGACLRHGRAAARRLRPQTVAGGHPAARQDRGGAARAGAAGVRAAPGAEGGGQRRRP